MTDFLASLDQQDSIDPILALAEIAQECSLLRHEVLRQAAEIQELRVNLAAALYLHQQTLGDADYAQKVAAFNALVENKLRNPTEPSEVATSSDAQAVS